MSEGKKTGPEVEKLFDDLAPEYDHMNNVVSLGTHRHWRSAIMKQMTIQPGAFILDVCCGTGDWTIALAEAVGPAGHIVGIDFSEEMLAIARKKIAASGMQNRITLVQGDAMKLPYPANNFDWVTIGFGLRNVPDAATVLSEMYRVLKQHGHFAALETAEPENRFIHMGWQVYFGQIVPLMGRAFVHRYKQYNYLQASTKEFLSARQLSALIKQTGFEHVRYHNFNLGAAASHLAEKK